jgi:ubiquitin-protein ligase E3 D
MASPPDSLDPSQPPIQIYAELHLNIRTISLIITLQTASSHSTTATLSADGHSISVTHDGHHASIRLPTQMQGGGSAALDLPAAPAKELMLRLLLQEKSPGLLRVEGLEGDGEVPWMAREIMDGGKDIRVRCRRCEAVVLDAAEKIREWKDLPNENWAEMMDLWHCHKPHDDDQTHDDGSAAKGYSATRSLQVEQGVGFISPSYFIVAAADCSNINEKVS